MVVAGDRPCRAPRLSGPSVGTDSADLGDKSLYSPGDKLLLPLPFLPCRPWGPPNPHGDHREDTETTSVPASGASGSVTVWEQEAEVGDTPTSPQHLPGAGRGLSPQTRQRHPRVHVL